MTPLNTDNELLQGSFRSDAKSALASVCYCLDDSRAFSVDRISRPTMSDRSARQRRIYQEAGKQQEQVQDRKPKEAARQPRFGVCATGVQADRRP
jgi:hypothetical protein